MRQLLRRSAEGGIIKSMSGAEDSIDIGFDLGGSKLFWLVRRGKLEESGSHPTGPLFTKADLIRIWREQLDALPEPPRYAGVACAGLIREQVVVQSDAMPGINGLSADDLVWRGVRPVLLNDADGALMGLTARQPGRENFAIVMVGTNIGMAYMMNGSICTGTTGMAGELGKVPVEWEGQYLPLDQLAGGAAIAKRCGLEPEVISRKLAEGDLAVCEVVNSAAELLGVSLAWLINLMNPETLYLGGGVVDYNGYLERAVATAQKHTLPKLFELCSVERVEKRDSIVAEGAIEQSRRS